MSDHTNEGTLSQEAAAYVLQRAAEIEVRDDGAIEVEELRQVAIDAGIPLAAFERALAEALHQRARPVPAPQVRPVEAPSLSPIRRISNWVRRAGLAGLGVFIATTSSALYPIFGVNADAAAMFSIILVGFAWATLVWDRRKDRGVAAFLFDLVPLWIGFTLTWMMADPFDAFGILAGMSVVGLISAVVGSSLVGIPKPWAQRNELPDSIPPQLLEG